MKSCRLSIIIPAYNEEHIILKTIGKVRAYLNKRNIAYDIIIVDDGSEDSTATLVQSVSGKDLTLLRQKKNIGKGAAIRRGVLSANGGLILVSDADLSTPITELAKLERYIGEFDIAIGSRALPGSYVKKSQPFYRVFIGKTFNKIVRLLTGLPFKDTQCGFKLFTSASAKRIFRDQVFERFSFDVEILYLAKKYGYSVKEVGVSWINDPKTTVHPIRDSARMFWDVIRLRATHNRP